LGLMQKDVGILVIRENIPGIKREKPGLREYPLDFKESHAAV